MQRKQHRKGRRRAWLRRGWYEWEEGGGVDKMERKGRYMKPRLIEEG